MIVITEILGTDSFSGSRLTLNANFASLANELTSFETSFGISIASGNIDVSAATGGQIKGKVGAFNNIQLPATGTPVITLNGTTGSITTTLGTLTTPAIQTASINITTGGNLVNGGSSVFNGQSTFNELVVLNDGFARAKIDVGATGTHTVLNTDNVILFDGSTSPNMLTLTPDISLVNGHNVTFVKYGTGACSLDTSLILGFGTGSINFSVDSYKSSITLQWSVADAKWFITSSSNMTIV
jgi:hypothetical protein